MFYQPSPNVSKDDNIVFYEGHTYPNVNQSISWTAAKTRCEKAGGHLVVLNSEEEEKAIMQFLNKNIWIGLWDEKHDGTFARVNGDELTFTAWGKDRPDNYENVEQYVMYWKDSIRINKDPGIHWNDSRNDEYSFDSNKYDFGYICEFDRILSTDEIIAAYSVFFGKAPEEIEIRGTVKYGGSDNDMQDAGDIVPDPELLGRIKIIKVLDLEVENISESEGKLISDLLGSALISQKHVKVIDRNQREKLLSEMEFSLSGCMDESCQLEIGRMLSADGIIAGSIGLAGSRYIMNIRLLDAETSEALSTSYEVSKTLDDMVDGCERIAIALVSGG